MRRDRRGDLKILHVIPYMAPRYGGPPKACFEMARAVAAKGHEVSIYSTDIDGSGRLRVDTARSHVRDRVAIRYFPVQRPRFWCFSAPLLRALRANVRKFDVAHLHSLYLFPGIAAAHFCRKHGVPYLVRPHGSLAPYHFRRHRLRKIPFELFFERGRLRGAAAIHYTSEDERRLSRPNAFGARGVVVPHGLDLGDYSRLPPRGSFRRRYPETGNRKILLFLGRLNYKKGVEVICEAFVRIASRTEDSHLVIAGPDEQGIGAAMQRRLARAGLSGRATFTGMLLGKDKLAAFGDASLFVLPSLYENFGIAVVEAMACRVPAVITDKVAIWREVAAAKAGVVAGRDPGNLAGHILRLLGRPGDLRKMGLRGRALVRRAFNWGRAAEDLISIYGSVRAGRRRDD